MKLTICILLISVVLAGCTLGKLLPFGNMFGKNNVHVGDDVTNNNYGEGSKVVHEASPWKLYAMYIIVGVALIVTPAGTIMVKRLIQAGREVKKWQQTTEHTVKRVQEYKKGLADPDQKALNEVLAHKQPEIVKNTVKLVKG